jgi:hypothetical protein
LAKKNVDTVGGAPRRLFIDCGKPKFAELVFGGFFPEYAELHVQPRLFQISLRGRPPSWLRILVSSSGEYGQWSSGLRMMGAIPVGTRSARDNSSSNNLYSSSFSVIGSSRIDGKSSAMVIAMTLL